jgi:uncharacterized protein (DUF1330 family)
VSAYLISQVEVLDPEAWENYRQRAAPAIARYGGRYLDDVGCCSSHEIARR